VVTQAKVVPKDRPASGMGCGYYNHSILGVKKTFEAGQMRLKKYVKDSIILLLY